MGYLPFLGPRATPVVEQASTAAVFVIVLTVGCVVLGFVPPSPFVALVLGAALGLAGSFIGDLFIAVSKSFRYLGRQI